MSGDASSALNKTRALLQDKATQGEAETSAQMGVYGNRGLKEPNKVPEFRKAQIVPQKQPKRKLPVSNSNGAADGSVVRDPQTRYDVQMSDSWIFALNQASIGQESNLSTHHALDALDSLDCRWPDQPRGTFGEVVCACMPAYRACSLYTLGSNVQTATASTPRLHDVRARCSRE